MKVKIAILIFLIAIVFSCPAAYGATEEIIAGMGHKLVRGCTNVLTGWLEIPMQIIKGYKRSGDEIDGKLLGAAAGFFEGIGCTIGRTAWGVVEVAGFWAANPKDNIDIGMPLETEYAWQEEDTMYGSLVGAEDKGIGPISKKFLRGLGNSLFGFAEFPGQIAKGIENKSCDLGITRGIWFWYSREFYGIADLVTFIFPNPDDNPGYAFDEEYPWDALVYVIEK